jgi:hypothetical protein
MTSGEDPYQPDPLYRRADPTAVGRALTRLGVHPPRDFVAFHEVNAGVIGSDHTGFELLDLCDGEPDYAFDPSNPSVVAATELTREAHGLPPQYLVISSYLGNAVLVYDTTTDLVYDMDFEGGHVQLQEGTLAPSYPSFRAFLDDFYGSS